MINMRTVCLEKDGHAYLFRYAVGLEDEVVEEIMHLADDRQADFSWLDAATLSLQVTSLAAEDCLETVEPDELALD